MGSVGDRIKRIRKELGLSVEDICLRLNKSKATIYRYESDQIENMSIAVLEPIAKALNVSPSYLMGWDNPADTAKIGDDLLKVVEDFKKLKEEDKDFVLKTMRLMLKEDATNGK